jgi:putative ABC transport system ATP-binding protein
MTEVKMTNILKSTDQENSRSIIKADNLHKTYLFGLEGVAALRGVSFDIKQGDFIIILGNSGGGKTSLLNILGTIDKQTKVLIL